MTHKGQFPRWGVVWVLSELIAGWPGNLLAALTTDRASARHLCRLCDEPLCASSTGCPVDQAAE